MSAATPPAEPEARHQVLRLKRHGTLLAKSSDFTRAAAILHTTEVEIGTDGVHDVRGGASHQTTAGVGFVSAATRLDRIFQKDIDSKKSGTPPPPPPPPPPSPLTKSLPPLPEAKGVASLARPSAPQAPSTVPRSLEATSSVSSDGSNTLENTAQQQQPPAVVPQPLTAPPPIEGMFIRSPTRHRKLIKTKLSDLPEDLQHQEPQIRGGVAIYKVADPRQRERYGNLVEINAIDYIDKLKATINDLERILSVLRGKLEHEKRENLPPSKQNLRSSLRIGTFMGKRSKEPGQRFNEKASKGVLRGKTVTNSGKPGQSANSLVGTKTRSSGNGPVRTESGTVDTKPPKGPKSQNESSSTQVINIPNGFRPTPAAPKPTPLRFTAQHGGKPKSSSPHSKVNIPSAFGGQVAEGSPTKDLMSFPGLAGHRTASDSASTLTRRAQSQSSAEDDNVPAKRQLSEPPSSSSNLNLVTPVSKDQPRTFQPRNNSAGDRNASPMPGVSRRTRRLGTVGRTRSFSGILGDSLGKRGTNSEQTANASRTFSMHRESIATPLQKKPEHSTKTTSKRSRGVRKLLGFR